MAADPSDIAQAVAESFEELNKKLGDANLRWGGLEKATQSLQIRMNATAKDYKDDGEAYKRLMRERSKRENEIIDATRKGTLTAREARAELEKLNKEVSGVIPPQFAQQFNKLQEANKFATDFQINNAKSLKNLGIAAQLGYSGLMQFGSAATTLIKAYQGGETDIRMAGTTTATFAKLLTSAGSAAGKGLNAIGDAALTAAPLLAETGIGALAVASAGIAAKGLGIALDYTSKAADQLAQTAIPILTTELDKLYTNFNAISSAGLVFSGGIREMANAGLAFKLTLPEFADVVKASSENLASLGISTTEAAKRMGEIGNVMRKDKTSLELQKLGFTFKEQAALVADTMSLMRQSGGRLTASDQDVAEQTKKYAENLRIISSITGEDAKKKEQQVRDQSNELAFQQKLAGMDEKQRQNTIAAMENMSDAQRKAFMETVVFGQAITPASAYAVANIAGFGDSVARAAQEFQNGTLDAESMRKNNADYGNIIKQSLIDATDLARAGMVEGISGFVKDLKGLYQNELQFRNVFTKEAVDAAEEAVKKQITATNEIDVNMIKAANAGRDMALTIQKEMLDSHVLEHTADGFAKVTDSILDLLAKFTGVDVRGPRLSEGENLGEQRRLRSRLAAMQERNLEQAANINTETAKAFAGTSAILPPSPADLATNKTNRIDLPNIGNLPTDILLVPKQFANGGLSSGPQSGYLATLHGTEAVLPENLTSMLMELANKPSQVEDFTKAVNNASLQNKSEDLLAMLNKKFDTMIDIMDDVAGHTQKTAIRVA